MAETDLELLGRYSRLRAEDAFAEIVRRHLGLVYSAALRQVRSPQLAEEVSQSVFLDLARQADRFAPNTILIAWLYQVTRRTAIDVVRRESRRQLREQIATEMNAMNATTDDWRHVEPILDEAMEALDATDRTAVLLRYFENKSLREVGTALGSSDDAAQKRVNRAVERLREFFAKRGVTVGASGLVIAISANAIKAAPIGLTTSISTATALAGPTIAGTAIKTIAMTTLQKTLIGVTLAAALVTSIFLIRQQDSTLSPGAGTNAETGNVAGSESRSNSMFWRRLDASRRAANAALSADADLRDALVRLKSALYAPASGGNGPDDPAYKILSAIPLAQRAAALEMVKQALHNQEQHVCRRAISLIPLIWPEGEAALPALFDLVRNKSGEWPGLAGEALMAAVQVRSEKDVIPELVLSAMQGGGRSQSELAMQFPLLKGQIKDSGDVFAASLLPFLYSTGADERLTAARALAQIPGTKDPLVVNELADVLTNGIARANSNAIQSSLGALAQMGPDAHDAIPALLTLAKENPDLHDSVWTVLKSIAPDLLQGVAVPTPLPPHQGSSQAISAQLQAGTWSIQDAINALNSPDLVLPTARALADFGPNASAALPALRQALQTVSATNLNAAIVISTAIERLDPQQPKPLLLTWDILPALDAVRVEAARVYAEAQTSGISNWDQSLASLHERIPFGLAFTHNDVRTLAAELGRIDARLQQAFQAKLLQSDPKFAAIFQPQGNR